MNILAFDIGGTWIRGGFFLGGKLVAHRKLPVSPQYRLSQERMVDMGWSLAESHRIDRIVVGLPGVLNPTQTMLLRSPHLRLWQNKPIKRDLTRHFKTTVLLENDATLGALGEALYGAGRGFRQVAYIAIGTGIGGSYVVDGRTFGMTNLEPGHQYIENGKTWEDMIGGKSLQRRFGPDWAKRERHEWDWIEQQLIIGLANIITLWSPERIVLGGAVIQNSAIRLSVVRRSLKSKLRTIPQVPSLAKARLRDSAGLYGALAMTR